jgi:hypothetical protein
MMKKISCYGLTAVLILAIALSGCGGGKTGGTVPDRPWTRQLGTAGKDQGRGIAVDAGGNIYVTGYTGGELDGNKNAGDEDLFLVKYDPSGIKQWTRQLGTASYDAGTAVAVDNRGNIYATGYTEGGLDGNTNAGEFDAFLIKF